MPDLSQTGQSIHSDKWNPASKSTLKLSKLEAGLPHFQNFQIVWKVFAYQTIGRIVIIVIIQKVNSCFKTNTLMWGRVANFSKFEILLKGFSITLPKIVRMIDPTPKMYENITKVVKLKAGLPDLQNIGLVSAVF